MTSLLVAACPALFEGGVHDSTSIWHPKDPLCFVLDKCAGKACIGEHCACSLSHSKVHSAQPSSVAAPSLAWLLRWTQALAVATCTALQLPRGGICQQSLHEPFSTGPASLWSTRKLGRILQTSSHCNLTSSGTLPLDCLLQLPLLQGMPTVLVALVPWSKGLPQPADTSAVAAADSCARPAGCWWWVSAAMSSQQSSRHDALCTIQCSACCRAQLFVTPLQAGRGGPSARLSR